MNYRNFFKIFSIGSIGYSLLEIIWRGYTHWSMSITGGITLYILDFFFSRKKRKSYLTKCIGGGIIITAVEFIAGIIFNRILKLNVWNYSNNKFNIAGQICLKYFLLWCLLCHPVSLLCDFMRKTP